MKSTRTVIGPRLRLVLQPGIAFGPGKADLLASIRTTGSIAAAGRDMGMSYKRAWTLIETLNSHFRAPLVIAVKGGPQGGGAVLTELGVEILERYQRMDKKVARMLAKDITALRSIVIANGK